MPRFTLSGPPLDSVQIVPTAYRLMGATRGYAFQGPSQRRKTGQFPLSRRGKCPVLCSLVNSTCAFVSGYLFPAMGQQGSDQTPSATCAWFIWPRRRGRLTGARILAWKSKPPITPSHTMPGFFHPLQGYTPDRRSLSLGNIFSGSGRPCSPRYASL